MRVSLRPNGTHDCVFNKTKVCLFFLLHLTFLYNMSEMSENIEENGWRTKRDKGSSKGLPGARETRAAKCPGFLLFCL